MMKPLFEELFNLCGSHASVAKALGYSKRHYRFIRQRVRLGYALSQRVQNHIKASSYGIKRKYKGKSK